MFPFAFCASIAFHSIRIFVEEFEVSVMLGGGVFGTENKIKNIFWVIVNGCNNC